MHYTNPTTRRGPKPEIYRHFRDLASDNCEPGILTSLSTSLTLLLHAALDFRSRGLKSLTWYWELRDKLTIFWSRKFHSSSKAHPRARKASGPGPVCRRSRSRSQTPCRGYCVRSQPRTEKTKLQLKKPSHAYSISRASRWSVPEWNAQSQTSLVRCWTWEVSRVDWLFLHLKNDDNWCQAKQIN